MSTDADLYLAHLGIDIPETDLAHYGKKGMKWGVRNEDKTASTPRRDRTPEEKAATRKKVIVGASIAAGILAAGAATYVGYDQLKLMGLKEMSSVGDMNINKIKESDVGDRLIKEGTNFARRSFLSSGAWPNDLRTYAVEGVDNATSQRYGDKVFNFVTSRDVRTAGVKTQLEILKGEGSAALRKSTAKEYARLSVSGRRYVNSMSDDRFANLTIETLRRSAWDGGESGSPTAQMVSSFMQRHGYAAINDLNLPGSTARVLLDKTAFRT